VLPYTASPISLTDVVNNRIPANLMGDASEKALRGRIVLIGAIAPSLNDLFYTPYSSNLSHTLRRMSGVVIHANLISQLVSDENLGSKMSCTLYV
jgi:adenylate cyclase